MSFTFQALLTTAQLQSSESLRIRIRQRHRSYLRADIDIVHLYESSCSFEDREFI
jgi:hypothetical protein